MARSYDLTSGSIPQHLLRLAAPLIMGNILQQLYNTVDAFILGRFAGDLEFAAVGVAGSVMNLFLFMITGACTGISVIFAQLYGAGERERFRREHWLALSCGLLVTLACSGLGFLLLSPLLRIIQTPSELKTFVSVYLTIILASLPVAFLYNLYGALLRAIGRANAALMVLVAAVTVNVALDYCFVARFQLGIASAAWATAASQAISAVLCILYLRRKAPELIFARADCRMDGELLKRTAHFSLVTALHQSSLYIGKLLVQGAVNTGAVSAPENLDYFPLYDDRLVIAAPNNEHYRAFRERGVYGRELLLEEPFVSREEGSGTDTSLQNYLRTVGLSHDMLHVVARVDDPEAIKQMVSGGVGVAVLSALAVEQEVQNGTLLAFEMDKSALKRTIYLITLKSQQLSRMEQKLVDFLKSPHRRKRAEAQN